MDNIGFDPLDGNFPLSYGTLNVRLLAALELAQ